MKFEFKKRKRKKSQKKKGVSKITSEDVPLEVKQPKYFEQEKQISKKISREDLEDFLNEVLQECTDYGDITIKFDHKVHITKKETVYPDNQYFVKVIDEQPHDMFLSTEKAIRKLKRAGELEQDDLLVDVTFFANYRILIFRK